MFNKVDKLIIALSLMILAYFAFFVFMVGSTAYHSAVSKVSEESFGAGAEITKLDNPTATKISMTADTATLILSTSTARKYVAIVNTATNTLTICATKATCVEDTGVRLNGSGGSYELTSENLWYGAIYGVLDTSTANIAVYYQQ